MHFNTLAGNQWVETTSVGLIILAIHIIDKYYI
jgi:hypothetical protein